ncbi:hypothetical protein V6N13_025658 [Hibiscus sabdariffa]|uniref:Uncharacterized protein n=1 Tax=Hibiscus sabdariffa TaxID=183260 RepID=A0ABR2C9Q0_9ROSI
MWKRCLWPQIVKAYWYEILVVHSCFVAYSYCLYCYHLGYPMKNLGVASNLGCRFSASLFVEDWYCMRKAHSTSTISRVPIPVRVFRLQEIPESKAYRYEKFVSEQALQYRYACKHTDTVRVSKTPQRLFCKCVPIRLASRTDTGNRRTDTRRPKANELQRL